MLIYNIFHGIHVLSAIVWLAAFILSLFWAVKVWVASGTDREKGYMQKERRSTSFGAHIGATGILVSGAVISSTGPAWGWFPFHTFTWLAVKQVIFILILILVAFSVKKGMAFRRQIKEEEDETVSKQARQKWKKAYFISLSVYLLVILNTILGSMKPF